MSVFMGGKSGSEDDKHIFTVRKVCAGGEAPQLRQSNSGAGFPKMVTDQSKVYGVWQVSSSSYGYEPYPSRSVDNGANWTTPQAVGSMTCDIGQTPAIARVSSRYLPTSNSWVAGTLYTSSPFCFSAVR